MCFTLELVARPSTILGQELRRGRDVGHAWPLTTEWSICGWLPNMRLNLVISGWKTLHQKSVNDWLQRAIVGFICCTAILETSQVDSD